MQVSMTVQVKTEDGLDLGTFTEEENAIEVHDMDAVLDHMAEQIATSRDMAALLGRQSDETTLGVPSTPVAISARAHSIPAPSIPRQINPRAVASGETRDPVKAAIVDLYRLIASPDPAGALLADLYVLFAQGSAEMERRGLVGYRGFAAFSRATAWMHEHHPERLDVQELTRNANPQAWQPLQPTGRTRWCVGDVVRLNEVSAAIFNTPPIRRRILMHIARERHRHTEEKHWTEAHDNQHNANDWIAILVQEIGEAVYTDNNPTITRLAMIKVAAVATAAAEALDRKNPEVLEVLAEMERKQQEREA